MPLAVLLALTLVPADVQSKSAVAHLVQRHYEATELYRRGDTTRALALLGTMTADEQQKAIAEIGAQLARIASGKPPKLDDVVPWPNSYVRALGALHFEAALIAKSIGRVVTIGPAAIQFVDETAAHHIALAFALFNLLQSVVKAEDRAAMRWILAIALDRMANGEFAYVHQLLQPYCEDEKADAALLVACGTIDEGFASLPAEQLMRMRPPSAAEAQALFGDLATLSYEARHLSNVRMVRAHWLGRAQRLFERALDRDPEHVEAHLRLGQVLVEREKYDDSASRLEKLAARPDLDARTKYFAHLFLARVRVRQERFDQAVAALAPLPPRQSVLLARAQLAQRRGDARQAAMLADQASRAEIDDPWWSYRYGQFWLRDGLFAELRAEARK